MANEKADYTLLIESLDNAITTLREITKLLNQETYKRDDEIKKIREMTEYLKQYGRHAKEKESHRNRKAAAEKGH